MLLSACVVPHGLDKTSEMSASGSSSIEKHPLQNKAGTPVPAVVQEPTLPERLRNKVAAERPGVLYFEFDRIEVLPKYITALRRIAERLRALPRARLRIIGHADELGSQSYNLALGQRRAEAVEQVLVSMGVSAGRIQAISAGETKPLATAHSTVAWAENRRVELVLIGAGSI